MKIELTITSTGTPVFSRPNTQKPPLGLLIPSGQSASTDVGNCTLASLFTHKTPSDVLGIELHAGSSIYELTANGWLNQDTSAQSDNVSISGVVTIHNPTNVDVGITW